jgi:hypothetical protein
MDGNKSYTEHDPVAARKECETLHLLSPMVFRKPPPLAESSRYPSSSFVFAPRGPPHAQIPNPDQSTSTRFSQLAS